MTIYTLSATQGLLSDIGTLILPSPVDVTTTIPEASSTSASLTTTFDGLNSTSARGSSGRSNASAIAITSTVFSEGTVGLGDVRGWAILLSTLCLGMVFYYH